MDVAVRAVLIAAGTAFILWALRIRPAAAQHAAWTTVLVVMLLLPIWSLAGPRISLHVLPAGIGSADSGTGGNPDLQVPPPGETLPIPGNIDPASGSSASSSVMWLLVAVYALGAVALLTRLAIGTMQARRLCRGAVMRAGRATSPRCATPITVGWLSPVLILPEGWDRWSAAQLDAVLTHEGAHASRRDPLVQWFALLNRAIFWFHPLAWWLERRLANLAEEACDAAVIQAGHSPQDYCDYLIDMARTLTRQGRRLNVVGMAMPGSGLPDRMKHIFEELPMKPLSRARIISTLGFCIISSLALATGTLASGAAEVVTASIAQPDAAPAPSVAEMPTLDQEKKTPPTLDPPKKAVAAKSPPVIMAKEVTPPGLMLFSAKVDLSGEWVQVDSVYKGVGRGGGGNRPALGGPDGRRMISLISGAAVNCGPTCTIVQDGQTLTVTRPPTAAPDTGQIGSLVLKTDGSESPLNESGHSKATAKWEGDKLVVYRMITSNLSVTQTLYIVDGRLHVESMFTSQDAPVVLIYEKR